MKFFYSLLFLLSLSIVFTYSLGAFNAYFYPMKYKNEINEFSEMFNIEGAVIASVANVESGFDENAKSNKGAIGIMQLMPSTAKWIVEKEGLEYNEEMLYEGAYNLKVGSCYLSYLIVKFGDVKTALCAYNAGPGNVQNWLLNEQYSKDGKTLYKIPFEETKKYLNKVLKNYNHYKIKYKSGAK